MKAWAKLFGVPGPVLRPHLRAAVALPLAAALLAGCSGGDGGGEQAASTTTTGGGSTSSTVATATSAATTAAPAPAVQEFPVPAGSGPHDVAVAADGTVWYTAQGSGELGRLDPRTGQVTEIALGRGARPHGVVLDGDGVPWITDSGLNAIVRVDPASGAVRSYPLPADRAGANLNTAAFDERGTLWFTGQSGIFGRLFLPTGIMEVFDAPGGRGPYGITVTPDGEIFYASLAGSHVAQVHPRTAEVTVRRPPTAGQGTRRVWADSKGRVWCSQWNAGQVAVYDPADGSWMERRLPGGRPQAYAVYVDDKDRVWLSDFGANALVAHDPTTGAFTSYPLPSTPGNVRQLHGRPGEVWGAESAADKLVVVRA
ncbi:MAG: virginiamycin B lyase family protein [Acidimicrobiales bacterium]